MIKLTEKPLIQKRASSLSNELVIGHSGFKSDKLNYIFPPSEFDPVQKYLDDVDCLMVGFASDSLLPLSVCGVVS